MGGPLKRFFPVPLVGAAGSASRRGRSANGAPVIWTLLLAPLIAVLAGLAVAVGGGTSTVAIAAMVLFVLALALPLPALFAVFFVLVFLVVGQLQYFGRIDKAFWIPYLLGLLLYLRVLLFSMSVAPAKVGTGHISAAAKTSLWLFGLFLVLALGSSERPI